jgi:hypothetical protein
MLLSQHICAIPKPMTFPINLNHQLQFRTVEIDDEMMNRLLPHELVTEHFSPLQIVPKQNLCKCAVVSEIPRALLQIFAVENFHDNPVTPFVKGEYGTKLDSRSATQDTFPSSAKRLNIPP